MGQLILNYAGKDRVYEIPDALKEIQDFLTAHYTFEEVKESIERAGKLECLLEGYGTK